MTIDTDAPRVTTRPSSGPAPQLLALPQLESGLPATPGAVDEHLARIEACRQSQLDALPPAVSDSVVAAAHRRTVLRILEQVRTARRRVSEGTYGRCARCSASITRPELEDQPWLTTCAGCPLPEGR